MATAGVLQGFVWQVSAKAATTGSIQERHLQVCANETAFSSECGY